ncbi:hypothetical protein J2754_001584 [Halarchaeum solikamskense]|uniref:hypothetical protein n=1 Tax=Halarchaeum nitratireducens TaxID=489913 RepID=UPI001B3AFEC4|nr:hypothetical protein [Halarchaeum solikamskense]MBP2251263.1 hypothetical protein [Halarchaeum solikamskense]
MTDDETDWPPGWTPRERVESVIHDHDAPDNPSEIAEDAGVDVETAREVVEQIGGRDYSDTRWSDDAMGAEEAADRLPTAAEFDAEFEGNDDD